MKDIIFNEIDRAKDTWISMADSIFDHPEAGFKEVYASGMLMKCLEENGFEVIKNIKHSDYFIRGNINLVKRIINNVFSNVLKYADIKQPVYITLLIDEDIENLGLTIKNTK